MKERPILFNGPMVRAILDGRKTQTRRIVKPQPANSCRYEMNGAGDKALHLADGPPSGASAVRKTLFVPVKAYSADHRLPCPYGAPGDRLWVRETWALEDLGEDGQRLVWRVDRAAKWVADGEKPHYLDLDYEPARWRPSIHMPRWASRITLEVTGLRVQRLLDISEEDARAEGLALAGLILPGHAVGCFSRLWDEINGERAPWSSNPWVWIVDFKRVEAGS